MKHLKIAALFATIIGASAACISLFTGDSEQIASGANSPNIKGDGNTVSYGGLNIDHENISKNKPNISREQFQAITDGMTYQEVLDIVKVPGTESAVAGQVKTYTWGTESYVYMVISFVNGKVHSKSQSGL